MGTNFYLQKKQPIEYYPTYHIGKRSCGWKPGFEYQPSIKEYLSIKGDYKYYLEDIKSVNDIKQYVDNGHYSIIDEYGKEYSWKDFEKEMLKHCPEGKSHTEIETLTVTKDEDGYEFIHCHYS